MSAKTEHRHPAADEYDDVYGPYVSKVPDGDVVGFMRLQLDGALALFDSIPVEKADFRYAAEKWSVKEVLGHVLDTEWIFTNRALRFARGDQTPLAGLDSSEYVRSANFGERELGSLVEEFRHMRSANLILFDSFDEAILDRRGTASNRTFTVRSKLFFIAGHAQHHLDVLREQYL